MNILNDFRLLPIFKLLLIESSKMKIFKKLQLGAIIAISFFLLAYASSAPLGNTGAPGEGTCAGSCHGGSASFGGDVQFLGLNDLPSTSNLVPEIDITSSAGSPVLAGYSVVALDDNNNQAGSWAFTNGSSGGRDYWGHQPALSFGGNSSVSDFNEWFPPNYSTDVTFYVCAVLANGNGNNNGDEVVCNQETITVTAPPPVDIVVNLLSDTRCHDTDDGSAEVVILDGTAPYTYAWDNGEDTATATMLTGGAHTVTVTDGNNTTAEGAVIIGNPDPIESNPTVTNVNCFGESTGSIVTGLSGGDGMYICSWVNILVSDCDLVDLPAGTYELEVSDGMDCVETFTYTITEPTQLNSSATGMDPTSAGAMDGTGNATASGGTPPYNFDWSNGDNTAMAFDLGAGMHTVTVTDVLGCESTSSITLSAGNCALQLSTSVTDVSCNGGSDGSISVTAVGAVGTVTYDWSNGSNTSMINNLPQGSYSVAVQDDAGCVVDATIEVTQPDSLFLTTISNPGIDCGDQGGELIVAPMGGTMSNYTLTWENGLTNDTIQIDPLNSFINLPDTLTNVPAGFFSYVFSDGNGCVVMDSILIQTVGSVPAANAGAISTEVCSGEDIELTETGGAAVAWDWSGPNGYSTTTQNPTIPNSLPQNLGTYTVTVTDATGCTNTSAVDIISAPDTTAPVLTCPQDFTVNTCGPVTYDTPIVSDDCSQLINPTLDTGFSSGSVFPSGTTTVTYSAIDGAMNVGSCSFNVTVTSDLTATFDTTPASCGQSDGSIIVTPSGGTPPYNFSPNNLTDLPSGPYQVTVVDSEGCSVTDSVNIAEDGGATLAATQTSYEVCPGSAATVCLNVQNGTPPYSLIVDGAPVNMTFNTDKITLDVNDLGAKDYAIGYGNGCTTNSVIISISELSIPSIIIPDVSLGCSSASIPISSVNLPLGFMIQGNPSELTAGTYNVIEEACSTVVTSFSVTGGNALELVSAGVVNSACTSSTGSINLQVTGGTPPYNYSPFGPMQGGLGAGNYSIVITDSSGCSLTETVTIGQVNGPSIAVAESTICAEASNGTIGITASGGTPPYSFRLGGSGSPVPTNDNDYVFNDLVAGSYQVFVIDANGCTAESSAVIRNHPALIIDPTFAVDDQCQIIEDSILLNTMGGVLPYNEEITINPNGTISVQVTDGVGCSVDEVLTAIEVQPLFGSANINYNCDGSSMVNFLISGGCPPYDTPSTVDQDPGFYTVQVTDAQGDTILVDYEILDLYPLSVFLQAISGSNSGASEVDIEVSGGIGAYTYVWTDASGATISNDQDLSAVLDSSQTVVLVITDENGCSESLDFFVDITVSTLDLDEADALVQLLPNPAIESLEVRIKSNEEVKGITIMDLNGQLISKRELNTNNLSLPVSDLDGGVYLLQVEFEKTVVMKRFLKI